MSVVTSQNWLHYSELESYIREHLEQESRYSCNRIQRACMMQSGDNEPDDAEIKITTRFDLVSKGEMILITPIHEWLESISYCYVGSIKLDFFPDDFNSIKFESTLILELKYCPCKLRNSD